MEAFLRIMVHNQALVTDELVTSGFAACERTGSPWPAMRAMGRSFSQPDTYEEGALLFWRERTGCGSGADSSGGAKTGSTARRGRCWR